MPRRTVSIPGVRGKNGVGNTWTNLRVGQGPTLHGREFRVSAGMDRLKAELRTNRLDLGQDHSRAGAMVSLMRWNGR